jgi:hypothetical protein
MGDTNSNLQHMKKCAKCKLDKSKSKFYKLARNKDGRNSQCKTCVGEYRGSKESKERDRKYHQSPRYRESDIKRDKDPIRKEKVNSQRRERRKRDPVYRMRRNLSRRTSMALKAGGFTRKSSLIEYLGCNIEFLKNHLEKRFQPGMSWDNYGYGKEKWNIDHKIPTSSAISVEEVYSLCHYSNLQPMWQPENIEKSDKII